MLSRVARVRTVAPVAIGSVVQKMATVLTQRRLTSWARERSPIASTSESIF